MIGFVSQWLHLVDAQRRRKSELGHSISILLRVIYIRDHPEIWS